MTTLAKELYGVLRLVATWLQQPTVIEVADSIEVHPHCQSARRADIEPVPSWNPYLNGDDVDRCCIGAQRQAARRHRNRLRCRGDGAPSSTGC
jgi:hypothetical protein